MGQPRGYWTEGRGPGRVIHPKMGSSGRHSRRMANVARSGIAKMPSKATPILLPSVSWKVPLQGRPLVLDLRKIMDASDALGLILVRDGLKPAGWSDFVNNPKRFKIILIALGIPFKRFGKRFYYGETPEKLQRLVNAEELGKAGKDGEFAIGRAL